MTYLGQLRGIADAEASASASTILTEARERAARSRFTRLRQHKVLPATAEEAEYMRCTSEYTWHKIRARRAYQKFLEVSPGAWQGNTESATYAYHKRRANDHRALMNRIEFGAEIPGRFTVSIAQGTAEYCYGVTKL